MQCENRSAGLTRLNCFMDISAPVFDAGFGTDPSEPPFRIKRFLTSAQLTFVYFASPALAILGYSLNIFVCLGLSKTSTIKKPTSTLMFTQMFTNLIAITCQGVAAPFLVYAQLIDRVDTPISRFIAGVAIFCTYTSLTLLIWITVNRHVFIWHPLRAEQVFTYRLALIACCTCFGVGAVMAMTSMFDCCYGGYSTISMTFAFVGPRSMGQYVFAWIYIGLILSTSFAAYSLLLWKIRKTKRVLARHHAAQRRILFGMETRLCMGFGIVALAWFVHLTTLIVPIVAFRYRHPSMSIFYACSRWAMFLVDPFVYLLLTQDLRWATWKCLADFLGKFSVCHFSGCCGRRQIPDRPYNLKVRKTNITVDAKGRVSPEEIDACLNSISRSETRETSSSL